MSPIAQKILYAFLLLFLVLSAADSPTWLRWKEARSKNEALPFPDFSYAGYEAGEREPPVAAGAVFKVTDFGAIPDDGKSDKEAIRRAIAAASEKGGIVFFPKGTYIAHDEGDENDSIWITAPNVILKGEGAGPGGSVIHYASPTQPVNPPSPLYAGPPLFKWQLGPKAVRDTRLTVLTADTRPGDLEIQVENASGLKGGDLILLDLKSREAIPDFMAGYETEAGWTEMTAGGIMMKERHQVASVNGNRVRLRECVYLPLKASWNVAVCRFGALLGCGVEDLHFTAQWKGDFKHHRSWMDDGGFTGLHLERLAHGWVRRCRFTDFNTPLSVVQGLHVSVLQVSLEGNGGHSGAGLYNSTACLDALLEETAPHWHGPGVAKGNLAGVFYRARFTERTSIELHASQPWGNLWDACTGGLIYAREGGDKRNLPNHLGKLVLWNFKQVGAPIEEYSFWRTEVQWAREVKPMLIGFHGSPTTFKEETCEIVESPGAPVAPGSLWEAQLALRLGKAPAWIQEARAQWPALLKSWGVETDGGVSGDGLR
ncbi:MAG: DUF4955 domain-containing protein [Spirochaetes bacterium]|nr:DUF4955 domain-containing protein [Spirochaetota bacterium]